MSIPITTRAYALASFVHVLETDLLLTATAYTACVLPVGSIVIGGTWSTTTAFNAETSAAISLGDSASATRYENAQDVRTGVGNYALTLTGYKTINATRNFLITPTYNSVLGSAGVADLVVLYATENMAHENFE
jgi:hypothetical protein